MTSRNSPIDLSEIAFPTDKVTLADIRKRQPQLFTGLFPATTRHDLSDLEIFATLSVERVLAQRAYAKVSGLPDPYPVSEGGFTRQEAVVMLNDDYKRYGLTTGLHQTRQIVRHFETASAALARTRHI